MTTNLTAHSEDWPIAGAFSISRGSKAQAQVVVAEVSTSEHTGRGEALPYWHYGETPAATVAKIRDLADTWGEQPPSTESLLQQLPAGAARNAVDCALWDLHANQTGLPVWQLAGLPPPQAVATAYTISLDSPANMASKAAANAHRPLLKLKLGQPGDDERLRAIRSAAPNSRLIVDVNEGWNFAQLQSLAPIAAEQGVEMIEQPLPATEDKVLEGYRSPVPLGADESLVDGAPLTALARRYQVVNIKLDKTGGLTAAIALQRQALALGLQVMIGCMVATSLSMAPALLLATEAHYIDLDGPLLLAKDRKPGLAYDESLVSFPPEPFWGRVQGTS